jgi:hypothetical protein
MSEIEERFLRLPEHEDYTRVRQFKIDEKGAVVSRGDSFRRRKRVSSQNNSLSATSHKNDNSPSPFPLSSDLDDQAESRSTSIGSDLSAIKSQNIGDEPSTSSHFCYKVDLISLSFLTN